MLVFDKTYDGESLCDLERDVVESLDSRYNPIVDQIPQDKHGISKGVFKVTITWVQNDDEYE